MGAPLLILILDSCLVTGPTPAMRSFDGRDESHDGVIRLERGVVCGVAGKGIRTGDAISYG